MSKNYKLFLFFNLEFSSKKNYKLIKILKTHYEYIGALLPVGIISHVLIAKKFQKKNQSIMKNYKENNENKIENNENKIKNNENKIESNENKIESNENVNNNIKNNQNQTSIDNIINPDVFTNNNKNQIMENNIVTQNMSSNSYIYTNSEIIKKPIKNKSNILIENKSNIPIVNELIENFTIIDNEKIIELENLISANLLLINKIIKISEINLSEIKIENFTLEKQQEIINILFNKYSNDKLNNLIIINKEIPKLNLNEYIDFLKDFNEINKDFDKYDINNIFSNSLVDSNIYKDIINNIKNSFIRIFSKGTEQISNISKIIFIQPKIEHVKKIIDEVKKEKDYKYLEEKLKLIEEDIKNFFKHIKANTSISENIILDLFKKIQNKEQEISQEYDEYKKNDFKNFNEEAFNEQFIEIEEKIKVFKKQFDILNKEIEENYFLLVFFEQDIKNFNLDKQIAGIKNILDNRFKKNYTDIFNENYQIYLIEINDYLKNKKNQIIEELTFKKYNIVKILEIQKKQLNKFNIQDKQIYIKDINKVIENINEQYKNFHIEEKTSKQIYDFKFTYDFNENINLFLKNILNIENNIDFTENLQELKITYKNKYDDYLINNKENSFFIPEFKLLDNNEEYIKLFLNLIEKIEISEFFNKEKEKLKEEIQGLRKKLEYKNNIVLNKLYINSYNNLSEKLKNFKKYKLLTKDEMNKFFSEITKEINNLYNVINNSEKIISKNYELLNNFEKIEENEFSYEKQKEILEKIHGKYKLQESNLLFSTKNINLNNFNINNPNEYINNLKNINNSLELGISEIEKKKKSFKDEISKIDKEIKNIKIDKKNYKVVEDFKNNINKNFQDLNNIMVINNLIEFIDKKQDIKRIIDLINKNIKILKDNNFIPEVNKNYEYLKFFGFKEEFTFTNQKNYLNNKFKWDEQDKKLIDEFLLNENYLDNLKKINNILSKIESKENFYNNKILEFNFKYFNNKKTDMIDSIKNLFIISNNVLEKNFELLKNFDGSLKEEEFTFEKQFECFNQKIDLNENIINNYNKIYRQLNTIENYYNDLNLVEEYMKIIKEINKELEEQIKTIYNNQKILNDKIEKFIKKIESYQNKNIIMQDLFINIIKNPIDTIYKNLEESKKQNLDTNNHSNIQKYHIFLKKNLNVDKSNFDKVFAKNLELVNLLEERFETFFNKDDNLHKLIEENKNLLEFFGLDKNQIFDFKTQKNLIERILEKDSFFENNKFELNEYYLSHIMIINEKLENLKNKKIQMIKEQIDNNQEKINNLGKEIGNLKNINTKTEIMEKFNQMKKTLNEGILAFNKNKTEVNINKINNIENDQVFTEIKNQLNLIKNNEKQINSLENKIKNSKVSNEEELLIKINQLDKSQNLNGEFEKINISLIDTNIIDNFYENIYENICKLINNKTKKENFKKHIEKNKNNKMAEIGNLIKISFHNNEIQKNEYFPNDDKGNTHKNSILKIEGNISNILINLKDNKNIEELIQKIKEENKALDKKEFKNYIFKNERILSILDFIILSSNEKIQIINLINKYEYYSNERFITDKEIIIKFIETLLKIENSNKPSRENIINLIKDFTYNLSIMNGNFWEKYIIYEIPGKK